MESFTQWKKKENAAMFAAFLAANPFFVFKNWKDAHKCAVVYARELNAKTCITLFFDVGDKVPWYKVTSLGVVNMDGWQFKGEHVTPDDTF